MPVFYFDTLAYAKKLESVGFDSKQAAVLVEMQVAAIECSLSSKREAKELGVVSEKLNKKINSFSSEPDMQQCLKDFEYNLTVRFALMMVFFFVIVGLMIQIK